MKKLSMPMITGLILAGIDLVFFWLYWAYTCIQDLPVCGEGMLAAYGLHLPSSLLVNFAPGVLRSWPYVMGPFFIFGIIQYFLIGYLLGWLGRSAYRFLNKHVELV